ncbi:MAG: ParB/RepB/Spo0J family partition protein [Xanthomonadales bacterium]|nr:ParB/RepB/Spo0J family partition protein [Xanthomonadales bacterium]
MAAKKRGLGRGLDTLLNRDSDDGAKADSKDALRQLPIEKLQPGRYQPRSHFDADALAELAESIKAQGVIQPVVVRPLSGGKFEIIAGERRWRAAQQAGLRDIPCVVRETDDNAALAMALIENIQREDLSAIEEAAGIQRLIDDFGMTHQAAAEAIGRSRSAVTNILRLLSLPKAIQQMILDGALDMGHARALLPLDPSAQLALAHRITAGGLNVREAEREAAKAAGATAGTRRPQRKDPDVRRLEEELSDRLGVRIEIRMRSRKGGSLSAHFSSLDQLETLLGRLR